MSTYATSWTRWRVTTLADDRRRLSELREQWQHADLAERDSLRKHGEILRRRLDRLEAEESRKAADLADKVCTETEWELLYAMREQLTDRNEGEVSADALIVAAQNLALVEEWAGLIDDIHAIAAPNPYFAARVWTVRDGARDAVVEVAQALAAQKLEREAVEFQAGMEGAA